MFGWSKAVPLLICWTLETFFSVGRGLSSNYLMESDGMMSFFFSMVVFRSLNVSLSPPVLAFLSVERLGKIGVLLKAWTEGCYGMLSATFVILFCFGGLGSIALLDWILMTWMPRPNSSLIACGSPYDPYLSPCFGFRLLIISKTYKHQFVTIFVWIDNKV